MSDDDRATWRLIGSYVDVTVYRNSIPIQVRQYGRVLRARPYPTQVAWDDETKERVSLEIVDSPDFVTYKPGQPFEAVVARDPITFELLRIVHIERTCPPGRLDSEEEQQLLDEIGSTSKLEEVGWDLHI
jgi:hypothetical protein